VTFPWGSIPLFGIDKVPSTHDAPLYATSFVWVMNKAKYESMSAAKEVIDDHAPRSGASGLRRRGPDFEHARHRQASRPKAHDVYQLTGEQLAEWKKAADL